MVFNPAIRAFCQRLKANGKHGMAIHCAAMRKLIHIAFAILKSGKPSTLTLRLHRGRQDGIYPAGSDSDDGAVGRPRRQID